MTVLYTSLSYDDYKQLEKQMRKFSETTPTTEPAFYHKSIRLKINPELTIEFHGPLVRAGEEDGRASLA